MSLSVRIAGIRLENPVVIASGILGTTSGLMKRLSDAGAGAITTKTTTLRPREGNPLPNVYELEFGLVNSMGLPNPGAEEMAGEIRRARKEVKIPIIASIAGESEEEFLKVASIMEEAGADAVELNLSCPHSRKLGLELGSDPQLVKKIAKEVRGSVSLPLLAKISAHFPSIPDYLESFIEHIDGVTAINTLKAMVIDVDEMVPVLGGRYGGLSGPAIRPIALRVVNEIRRAFPDISIIGVGGVEDWRSALEMIMAGADAVGIGTAIRKGLNVIEEIKLGISRFLSERGLSLEEIRGIV
ncbi:MAG: dihydroorotate dehydrogenase [Candidatus Methanodesulfokora sp.]